MNQMRSVMQILDRQKFINEPNTYEFYTENQSSIDFQNMLSQSKSTNQLPNKQMIIQQLKGMPLSEAEQKSKLLRIRNQNRETRERIEKRKASILAFEEGKNIEKKKTVSQITRQVQYSPEELSSTTKKYRQLLFPPISSQSISTPKHHMNSQHQQ